MANVHVYMLDTDDFFDSVVFDNEDTEEWEEFLADVAYYAAEDDPAEYGLHSRFDSFLEQHGYMNQIEDILYDAMKAFTNERIRKTGAGFDLV